MQSNSPQWAHLEGVKQPQNVKVLILAQNKTSIREFSCIRTYKHVMKIDLSYNKLSAFPAGFTFGDLPALRTLFLHYNKFTSLKNLMPAVEAKSLQYLTLFGNPLEEAKARHLFVNEIPGLMLMDDKVVNVQERCETMELQERTSKILSFPLLSQSVNSEDQQYLIQAIQQLTILRRQYLDRNPILKIQRWWRLICRKKHRKWSILTLSKEQDKLGSALSQRKKELDRLITEKMEISRSQSDIVNSLLHKNYQFWLWLRQTISQGEIYLTRQYCVLNAIDFDQIDTLRVIRNIGDVSPEAIKNRRQLRFFLQIHRRIIAVKRIENIKKQKEAIVLLNKKSRVRPYKLNKEKSLKVQQKMELLDMKYEFYVRPQLDISELLAIVKKEQFKYIKSSSTDSIADPFPVLSSKLLERSMAAVNIQRFWRGSKVRKIMNARKRIRQEQAASVIQRWVRGLKFRHRYQFLLQMSSYLRREEKSTEIILEMSQLPAIQDYCTFKQNYGKLFMICFQQCTFIVKKTPNLGYSTLALGSVNRWIITFHAERKPYPSYLNLTFNTGNFQPQNYNKSSILEILFKGVKDIERIVDNKGTKFIRFEYESKEQALNRKFILALKTYRMHNNQYISSLPRPKIMVSQPTNIIDAISQNIIVSMNYEEKDEHQPQNNTKFVKSIKKLQNKKSVSSLHGDITMIGDTIRVKIRYFIVTSDFSCILLVKELNYRGKNINNTANKQLLYGNSSRNNMHKQVEHWPSISRSIISLDQLQNKGAQIQTNRKESARYDRILNTDQSHSYIGNLSPQQSIQHIESHSNRRESYDKFNREIYPSATQPVRQTLRYKIQQQQFENLKGKRQLIESVRQSHRQKINDLVRKKSQHLNSIKQIKYRQHLQNQKMIQNLKEQLQKQKARRHDRIKQRMKPISQTFQGDFMQKGMTSIKKTFRNFQKKSKNKSFQVLENGSHIRYSQKMGGDHQRPNDKHITVEKTQIKQFSIGLSQRQSSAIPTQVARQNLKSLDSIKHERSRQKSQKSQLVSNLQLKIQDMETSQQKSKMKKRRMVHSVFPQEFYPLKQSKQMGFQLPKVRKN